MNLRNLFETQKAFRERVNYQESDRFEKLILALLVELGECANEWRGFKFWSKNQNANIMEFVPNCYPPKYKNPLLEEYVDGLHFVLEVGLENGWTPAACDLYLKADNINKQLIDLFRRISTFHSIRTKDNYFTILELYVGLGEMLGFCWEEIEQAYYAKNQINHARQENGY